MPEYGHLRPETHQEEQERRAELEKFTNGAVAFAHHLVTRWPQVDTHPHFSVELDEAGKHIVDLPPLPEGIEAMPQLNYYLGGSLAIRLLAKAETLTPIVGSAIPHIEAGEPIAIPQSVREALLRAAKPVGDVDFVPTRHYKEQMDRANRLYDHVSQEAYVEARKKLLFKGGSGPAIDELSDKEKDGMRIADRQGKIMIDPVQTTGKERVAKIEVGGQEYYVATPDALLAYKILHAVQKFQRTAEVMAPDLEALLSADLKMYDWSHLVEVVREVLHHEDDRIARSNYHSASRPKYICKDMTKDTRFTPLIRQLIEEATANL